MERMQKSRVLIIGSEDNFVRLVRRTLEESSYAVSVATDCRIALDNLIRDQPDVVLLDDTISGQHVLEACREFRHVSAVPIIFLGSKDTPEGLREAIDCGADDYVRKPLKFRELIARIDAKLKWARREDSRIRTSRKDI